MEERKRSIQKKFRLTEQENLRLCVKMGHAHTPSFQYYARKMCLDRKVMRVDYGAIRELTREVHKIGVKYQSNGTHTPYNWKFLWRRIRNFKSGT